MFSHAQRNSMTTKCKRHVPREELQYLKSPQSQSTASMQISLCAEDSALFFHWYVRIRTTTPIYSRLSVDVNGKVESLSHEAAGPWLSWPSFYAALPGSHRQLLSVKSFTAVSLLWETQLQYLGMTGYDRSRIGHWSEINWVMSHFENYHKLF